MLGGRGGTRNFDGSVGVVYVDRVSDLPVDAALGDLDDELMTRPGDRMAARG